MSAGAVSEGWGIAWRIARRELRGGLGGFRIFLICLILGVATIAGVGSVASAIGAGLTADGRSLLGGDVELRLTHRFAEPGEEAYLRDTTRRYSATVDFRAMAAAGEERILAQVKGVDGAYPLFGEVILDPPMPLAEALAERDGVWGAVAERALVDRMGIAIGDTLTIGTRQVALRALITKEPDRAISGITLGPRLMVGLPALEGSGLLQTGSLFYTDYRLDLPEGLGFDVYRAELDAMFPKAGWRWRDAREGAPGAARFVDRIGSFLVLVGLASLAVGGVGVSAATRAYMERKTPTIATLKTVGASGGLILRTYALQIGVLALAGVTIGVALGGGIPLLLAPWLAEALPVPSRFGLYPGALAEAAAYGLLTAALFALPPLARARETRAARLFRDLVDRREGRMRPVYWLVCGLILLALAGIAILLASRWQLAAGFIAGLVVALGILRLAAWGIAALARRMARSTLVRGRPNLRLALAAAGGPGGETAGVVLSLGLGLTLLASIGQIDANLRGLVEEQLPRDAPAFFFIDIQPGQRDSFVAAAEDFAGVEKVETAPMIRGRITARNGADFTDAQREGEGGWMLRGDRGLTYADAPPEGARLTEGEWWAPDESAPLVSLIDEEGRQLGFEIGDEITINVLGRDLTARVANFREVEWQGLGINFVMIFNRAALEAAPHTHIATVYATPEAEAPLMRTLSGAFPNVSGVRVRDAVEQASTALGRITAAVRGASGATILTGLAVLIGAAAAGQARRIYDAAILKTVGATRGDLLRAFALRFGLIGAAAAIVALGAGALAAWAVMTFVMDTTYSLDLVNALTIIIGGIVVTLIAGALFAWGALSVRPARALRARE